MKRVLVTGGGGFVGAHVARQLVGSDYEVAILASPSGSQQRLEEMGCRVTVIRADLTTSEPALDEVVGWRPDTCIHLAWYAESGKCLTADVNIPLLNGSLVLLRTLIRSGCRKFVMAGTCAEYDADVGYFHEDSPTKPLTLYAATKLSLSMIASQVASGAGVSFAWARLFLLYGRYENERRAVPAVIKSLLAGQPFLATLGEQVRDYLHVEDVASALCTLATSPAGGVFNVCSGDPVTVRRLMMVVGDLIGRPELIQFGAIPYRPWDPPFLCGSNSKLRSLGWAAKHDLQAGLADAIDWWRLRRG